MRVLIAVAEVAVVGVAVARAPGLLVLCMSRGIDNVTGAYLARAQLSLEERDAVRAHMGVVPTTVDATVLPWGDTALPTVDDAQPGEVIDLTEKVRA